MTLSTETAIAHIQTAAQAAIAHVDIWYPDTETPGGFLTPTDETIGSGTPLLLGDNGNLLIAVVAPHTTEDFSSPRNLSAFANEGVRKLGSRLHRAAIDYEIHRLVVILILPNNAAVSDALTLELSNPRYTAGQFRTVMLPHRECDEATFKQQTQQRLELFSPFPKSTFLEPVVEDELESFVDGAFATGPYAGREFTDAIKGDIKDFLSAGIWGDERPWPKTSILLNSISPPQPHKNKP